MPIGEEAIRVTTQACQPKNEPIIAIIARSPSPIASRLKAMDPEKRIIQKIPAPTVIPESDESQGPFWVGPSIVQGQRKNPRTIPIAEIQSGIVFVLMSEIEAMVIRITKGA